MTKDVDKAEVLNASFASVCISKFNSQGTQPMKLDDGDKEQDEGPPFRNLHSQMGFTQEY